jgi:hypothetical protein
VTVENLQSIITGGTGAIVVMVVWLTMILSDKLHTDGEFSRVAEALQLEKTAHTETRKALEAAADRADAAVRSSELIADAFTAAAERRGEKERGEDHRSHRRSSSPGARNVP